MNSRQRRKFKRKWKHKIILKDRGFVEFDESITWAHKTFGYYKYMPGYDPRGYCMMFDDDKNAAQFALRWL